jgi:hypothetical protein
MWKVELLWKTSYSWVAANDTRVALVDERCGTEQRQAIGWLLGIVRNAAEKRDETTLFDTVRHCSNDSVRCRYSHLLGRRNGRQKNWLLVPSMEQSEEAAR